MDIKLKNKYYDVEKCFILLKMTDIKDKYKILRRIKMFRTEAAVSIFILAHIHCIQFHAQVPSIFT